MRDSNVFFIERKINLTRQNFFIIHKYILIQKSLVLISFGFSILLSLFLHECFAQATKLVEILFLFLCKI